MEKMSMKEVLERVQAIQKEELGRRIIYVHTYLNFFVVTLFEKDYDEKEDGRLKDFYFYDFMDGYGLAAEFARLMDYYNGQEDEEGHSEAL